METTDLLKKVRQIEIKTRGLSNNIFAGQYHSAFKGRGMAFSEVREYQFGDDIRVGVLVYTFLYWVAALSRYTNGLS